MATPEKRTGSGGFTLIELSVVLAILAIFAAVALPRFAGIVTSARLRRSAMRLAGTVLFVQGEAVRTGRVHKIHFDMAKHSYRVTQTNEKGEEEPARSDLAREYVLPEDVSLEKIFFPGAGGRTAGTPSISISPLGSMDPCLVQLADEYKRSVVVLVKAYGGQAKVLRCRTAGRLSELRTLIGPE